MKFIFASGILALSIYANLDHCFSLSMQNLTLYFHGTLSLFNFPMALVNEIMI